MKIIIFGATGTGKTTLGHALSKKLNGTFLDSDTYYWEKTNPPFEKKVPLAIRNENLKADFFKSKQVVVSGTLCTWSEFWDTAFDLGVFLRLSKDIRMKRLYARELHRYGHDLESNPAIKKKSTEFLEWADQYDNPYNLGHSITRHLNWIEKLQCPVVELNGNETNEQRLTIVQTEIDKYHSLPSFPISE